MKKFFLLLLGVVFLEAHPVSYTIDLKVSYDESSKKATIVCTSNSKNKCGLYSFHLLNKDEDILKAKRFPFLKKQTTVVLKNKPYKMLFFLRKVPEHSYISIFE